MASEKTQVIEFLFNERYDGASNSVDDPVVTFNDLARAIRETGAKLSTKNLANFWKDIVRASSRNNTWPADVFDKGWTGTDAIGQRDSASFAFVEVDQSVKTPFPEPPEPSQAAIDAATVIETLSIPLASKQLGRSDETWVSQVAQRLKLIEQHFAVASPVPAAEIEFLQTSVGLAGGEVDAVYRLIDTSENYWLIAVEAKGRKDLLHLLQLSRSSQLLQEYANNRMEITVSGVIPVGLKVIGVSRLHVVEFASDGSDEPAVVAESVFLLQPAVPGID